MLQDLLNSGSSGHNCCVYLNVEGGQAMREAARVAMRSVLGTVHRSTRLSLGDTFVQHEQRAASESSGPGDALAEILSLWAAADPLPLNAAG